MKTLVNVYAMIYAICFLSLRWVWHKLDWFGEKLVYLIDNSNFFAGIVVGLLIGEILGFLGK